MLVARRHAIQSTRRTILGFAKPGLEVIERKTAHGVLEAVDVHGGRKEVLDLSVMPGWVQADTYAVGLDQGL